MSERQQRIQAKIDEAQQARRAANPDEDAEPEDLPPPAYSLEPSASSSASSQPQASGPSAPSALIPVVADDPLAHSPPGPASSSSLPLAPSTATQHSTAPPAASGSSVSRSPSVQAPHPQVVLAPPGEEPSGLSMRDQKIMSDIMPDEPQEEPHPRYEEHAGPSQFTPPQGPYAPPPQQYAQSPYASPPAPHAQYSPYGQHQGPSPPGPSQYAPPYADAKAYAGSLPPPGAPGAQQWDFGQYTDKSGSSSHGKEPQHDLYRPTSQSPYAPAPDGQGQPYGYAPDKAPYAPHGHGHSQGHLQPSMDQQYPGYHFPPSSSSFSPGPNPNPGFSPAPGPSGSERWDPRPLPQGSSRGSIASSSQGPPPSWNRLPARDDAVTYAPFPPLALLSQSSHLSKGFPEAPPPAGYAPHPFATHDVQGEDWARFLADIKKTASAVGDTYNRSVAPFLRHQIVLGPLIGLAMDGAKAAVKAASKSPSAGVVVDDWNTFFFNPRRINVSLVQGEKRLSGLGYNDPALTRVPSASSSQSSSSRGNADLGRYLSKRESKRAAREQEKAETPFRLVVEPF
ncbi:hypothetical protein CONPUDRAFT_84519 [Coniophora puteana RWD-64-598 SS2]|uniref:Uncharacterized protein n=1 Tax=Coniophora puteana (strain RWD-64-598) TaxID=741705 RepID=A0A5M3MFS1_CONPW|nr:uncharacterized protein CONPUDRAFT_84519 [Coniophora puteana RWD-64-598 SS2]EIW77441.1 hypothetical protein CONPUDRAFT_84519 [Coniophora puteana RWD-64-598 SS2]